jgi:hypothetical protein
VQTGSAPIPDDVVAAIQAYIDKHSPIDESESQRFHDELYNFWVKEVRGKHERYPAFITVLREAKCAIRGTKRWQQWWDVLVMPVLGRIGEVRALAKETRLLLLELMVYDSDQSDTGALEEAKSTSSLVAGKLMEIWLRQSGAAETHADATAQYMEQQIKIALMSFGNRRRQEFFNCLDRYFVKKQYREQILTLLCEFIRNDAPQMHLLIQTPLFANLLRCLQIDTSTTVVALAMTALTMFLPHIPVSSGKHLSALFNIYTRMLFWERERVLSPRLRQDTAEEANAVYTWDKSANLVDNEDETLPELELLHYFTLLYGLYPLNLMSYIRKPGRYLRHANFVGADEIDVEPEEIRKRSEPFIQMHLLHPNFVSLTIESELTDAQRWMKSAASDVVTFCMSLCVPIGYSANASPQAARISGLPSRSETHDTSVTPSHAHEEESGSSRPISNDGISWRNTMSTIAVQSPEETSEGQALSKLPSRNSQIAGAEGHPLQLVQSPEDYRSESPARAPTNVTSPVQDMLNSNKSLRNSLQTSLRNDSSTTLSTQNNDSVSVDSYLLNLAQQTSRPESLKPNGGHDVQADIVFLHREIMLLKNDLNFERYLKQQHLAHIGKLRRNQVREATVEAETQNLINANKILKSKLDEAKKLTVQTKREFEKARAQSRKWEADVAGKLRAIKEEQKKWIAEREALKRELDEAKTNNEQLKRLVLETEERELQSARRLEDIQIDLQNLERLKADVESLTKRLRRNQASENGVERVESGEGDAASKIAELQLQLSARGAELQQTRDVTSREISELQARLRDVEADTRRTVSQNVQSIIDGALAANTARMEEMQRAHQHLLKRYQQLSKDYMELQELRERETNAHSHGTNGRRHSVPLLGSDADTDTPRNSASLRRDGLRDRDPYRSRDSDTGSLNPPYRVASTVSDVSSSSRNGASAGGSSREGTHTTSQEGATQPPPLERRRHRSERERTESHGTERWEEDSNSKLLSYLGFPRTPHRSQTHGSDKSDLGLSTTRSGGAGDMLDGGVSRTRTAPVEGVRIYGRGKSLRPSFSS